MFCAALFLALLPTSLAEPRPSNVPAASPQEFQPGIRIDWQNATVHLAGKIVLKEGPLEFIACFRGKEHESIVRLDADAMHVYLALGLVGLTPSTQNVPSALCEIRVRWNADGEIHEIDASQWLIDRKLGQIAVPRAYRFTGSMRKDDRIVAANTGSGFALVSMPDALTEPTHARSNRDQSLWVRARATGIPAKGSEVTILVAPARPVEREIRMDATGQIWIDGHPSDRRTLAEIAGQSKILAPEKPLVIRVGNALEADIRRLRRTLDRHLQKQKLHLKRSDPESITIVPDASESDQ